MSTRRGISASFADADYKEVRSLSRGLQVLQALNRAPGGIASTTELAQTCGVHRTTVKRLLETLRADGFVRRGEKEGQYYLTFAVRSLSEGFVHDDWVEQVALPLMRAALPDLMWPCDLGALEGGFMVVRESTHRFSLLSQHRGMIGEKLPLFFTAMGRAYLAACSEAELEGLLALLMQRDDPVGAMARDRAAVDMLISETRARGYAVNDGDWEREAAVGAIAVPILCAHRLVGGINLIFPRAAVSSSELESRYLPRLKRLAARIGKDMQPWLQGSDESA
ncbi:DNA-binding transcriptional regulator [Diaphorobacter sp. HDW4A]|uniref:DNA-binding transcriptional regulator n=1 Tax=Diaphorobacter sp. HDW4A TaxID=2714924 RepID=UPI001409A3AD|nr:DNA-binding transcriptional regulator [Diaphorobacter sp. HDW4A]QIL79063.1 DNA-binding transcriptional regulator [Diaphorobacter sp. HDW4A]